MLPPSWQSDPKQELPLINPSVHLRKFQSIDMLPSEFPTQGLEGKNGQSPDDYAHL
jgi:hypothetical protein